MTNLCRGPLARLKLPALTAVLVGLFALPVAAPARSLAAGAAKRPALQRGTHGGRFTPRTAGAARVRTGRARDKRRARRRP